MDYKIHSTSTESQLNDFCRWCSAVIINNNIIITENFKEQGLNGKLLQCQSFYSPTLVWFKCPLLPIVIRNNQWRKERAVLMQQWKLLCFFLKLGFDAATKDFFEDQRSTRRSITWDILWASGQALLFTLWLSIRLRTRSMSPCTGWSSASWGSTLYSQSMRAWRASVNWPENSRASSSLFCLQESTNH